jgi:hypothetical protein
MAAAATMSTACFSMTGVATRDLTAFRSTTAVAAGSTAGRTSAGLAAATTRIAARIAAAVAATIAAARIATRVTTRITAAAEDFFQATAAGAARDEHGGDGRQQ